jgi:hypothetical protein
MTIYIDVVIIENLIMNYIILYATSIVLKKQAKNLGILISSIIRSNLCNNTLYISNKNIFIDIFKNTFIYNYGLYGL